jgi:hypothetical protein
MYKITNPCSILRGVPKRTIKVYDMESFCTEIKPAVSARKGITKIGRRVPLSLHQLHTFSIEDIDRGKDEHVRGSSVRLA